MMVVLGLGSNLGDRLDNLKKAWLAIQDITGLTVQQVSPIYISDALLKENAPTEWNLPYLNLALRCETSLEPLNLLQQVKKIENNLGRVSAGEIWAPRVIDIDILIMDNIIIQTEILTLPHRSLLERPFALWPLADVAPLWQYQDKTAAQMVEVWGSRFTGNAPFHTKQIPHRIDTPQLVGVLNITPDSFSDGGKFFNPEQSLAQFIHLANAGAHVIDIGAESTMPTAEKIEAKDEWARLEPILSVLKNTVNQCLVTPKISIDTRHSEVAEKALQFGVDWINDVSGLDDSKMREVIAASNADCVVMHHLKIPERREYTLPRHLDPTEIVYRWAEERLAELEKQGIAANRVIFDPGIGFGKMAEQSLLLLKNSQVFKQLGVRILIGHSRKTFMSLLTNNAFAERDVETMALTLFLANQSVDYIRVHNVEWCARGLRVMKAL